MPYISARILRVFRSAIASLLGLLMGVLAIIETIFPPATPCAKAGWLITFGILFVVAVVAVVRQAIAEDSRSEKKESAREIRERQEQERDATIEKMATRLALLDPQLGLAAKTLALADELTFFIRNQGFVPPGRGSPVVRAIRAAGGQLGNFPDEMIVENYRSTFGERMGSLIPQLQTAGTKFHHDDNYYVNPPSFMIGNTLQTIAVELKAAGLALAAK